MEDKAMLILADLYCPICEKTANEKGRNGLTLCDKHGWIEPVRAITLAVKSHKGLTTTLKNNN
jgi:hypothetical protein